MKNELLFNSTVRRTRASPERFKFDDFDPFNLDSFNLIKNGHLFLSLRAAGGIYEFEPLA